METDFLKIIETRRSCRKYKKEQVKDSELKAVLEAGTYAPTSRGMQSPYIVAVQNEAVLRKLAGMNAKVMGATSNPYYDAPTYVLVFASLDSHNPVQDGSCVLENMMLAAHAIGLASCWIHREREMFETPEGKELIREWGLPENIIGVGALALGYADGDLPKPKPRKEGYYRIVK
ncbi:nitroreductase family protein [Bacteroides ilei]|uniref:nitroreductase family protein n=1 Tax=Bacteroides ilei TaxID=1907658 RepID=UPI0009312CA6|nr:nitroreductase [Bacteroides ilei]